MICKQIVLVIFLNEPELICLPTIKWFQFLLYNTNNSTLIICLHTVTWLNRFI